MSRIGIAAVSLLGLLIGVVVSGRLIAWQMYWLPSGAMEPTLNTGEYVVAWKLGRDPHVGDVVVFRATNRSVDYVSRIVAQGGDTVRFQDGTLVINGTIVPRQAMGTFVETIPVQGQQGHWPRCKEGAVGAGGTCTKDVWHETLANGVAYLTFDFQNAPLDNTPSYTVPQDHVFVVSDNRDNAIDSRMPVTAGGFGFISRDAIIGRMVLVVRPRSRGLFTTPVARQPKGIRWVQ